MNHNMFQMREIYFYTYQHLKIIIDVFFKEKNYSHQQHPQREH